MMLAKSLLALFVFISGSDAFAESLVRYRCSAQYVIGEKVVDSKEGFYTPDSDGPDGSLVLELADCGSEVVFGPNAKRGKYNVDIYDSFNKGWVTHTHTGVMGDDTMYEYRKPYDSTRKIQEYINVRCLRVNKGAK